MLLYQFNVDKVSKKKRPVFKRAIHFMKSIVLESLIVMRPHCVRDDDMKVFMDAVNKTMLKADSS